MPINTPPTPPTPPQGQSPEEKAAELQYAVDTNAVNQFNATPTLDTIIQARNSGASPDTIALMEQERQRLLSEQARIDGQNAQQNTYFENVASGKDSLRDVTIWTTNSPSPSGVPSIQWGYTEAGVGHPLGDSQIPTSSLKNLSPIEQNKYAIEQVKSQLKLGKDDIINFYSPITGNLKLQDSNLSRESTLRITEGSNTRDISPYDYAMQLTNQFKADRDSNYAAMHPEYAGQFANAAGGINIAVHGSNIANKPITLAAFKSAELPQVITPTPIVEPTPTPVVSNYNPFSPSVQSPITTGNNNINTALSTPTITPTPTRPTTNTLFPTIQSPVAVANTNINTAITPRPDTTVIAPIRINVPAIIPNTNNPLFPTVLSPITTANNNINSALTIPVVSPTNDYQMPTEAQIFAQKTPLQQEIVQHTAETSWNALNPVEKAGLLVVGSFNKPAEIGGAFLEQNVFGGAQTNDYQRNIYTYEMQGANTVSILGSNIAIPPTPVLTDAATSLAMAYGTGFAFRAGSSALRLGLQSVSSTATRLGSSVASPLLQTGANIVSRGALLAERTVEPAAVAAGIGYMGYGLSQSNTRGELAANVISIGVSLPLASMGWNNAGGLISNIRTRGLTTVEAPIKSEVLSGRERFPTTRTGTFSGLRNEFTTPTGEIAGYHSTPNAFPAEGFSVRGLEPKALRSKDVPGLYISPVQQGASPAFLRVGGETSGSSLKGWTSSEPLNPQINLITGISDVRRVPNGINVQASRNFLYSEAPSKGTAYIEPKMEMGGFKGEAQAVLPIDTQIGAVTTQNRINFKGNYIPLVERAVVNPTERTIIRNEPIRSTIFGSERSIYEPTPSRVPLSSLAIIPRTPPITSSISNSNINSNNIIQSSNINTPRTTAIPSSNTPQSSNIISFNTPIASSVVSSRNTPISSNRITSNPISISSVISSPSKATNNIISSPPLSYRSTPPSSTIVSSPINTPSSKIVSSGNTISSPIISPQSPISSKPPISSPKSSYPSSPITSYPTKIISSPPPSYITKPSSSNYVSSRKPSVTSIVSPISSLRPPISSSVISPRKVIYSDEPVGKKYKKVKSILSTDTISISTTKYNPWYPASLENVTIEEFKTGKQAIHVASRKASQEMFANLQTTGRGIKTKSQINPTKSKYSSKSKINKNLKLGDLI